MEEIMFGLSPLQKDAIGLTFLVNQLSPASPYGGEKIKQIAPFGRDCGEELAACFGNLETIIFLLKENSAEMEELRLHLMEMKNISGSIAQCKTQTLNTVELFEIKNFLLVFEKLHGVFKAITAKAPFKNIHLQPMPDALAILDPDALRIAAFTADSAELQAIRREKLHTESLLQKETKPSAKEVLAAKRFALVQKEAAEEALVLRQLSEKLRPHLAVFLSNIDNIGALDMAIAKAALALKYNAVRPKINDGEKLLFQNMSNPYIEDALSKNNQTMTKVSITMTKGVTIITGANMGGKSVAMKTAVLNAMLCQMGFFVFAERAEIPLFDDIYLISEDMQDAERGLSSFGAEIARFNEIAARLKTGFLFVALDEFAKGTNPHEGACIVRAAAAYLADSGSVCVLSTHYDGIVSPKFRHYQVAGLKLPDAQAQASGGIASIAACMDYSLIEADANAAPPRDALNVCKLLGLDADVLVRIERAYAENS